MRILLLLSNYCLQTLAIICIAFSFIPIFFVATISLILLIIFGIAIVAYFIKKYKIQNGAKKNLGFLKHITKTNKQALRLSIIAIVANVFLYTAMRTHIQVCYINNLNNELEPIRETFRERAKTIR